MRHVEGGGGEEGRVEEREKDKGGRGEEGGSAQEEESAKGFRGSEGMMVYRRSEICRESGQVVGWLLAFKLSSSPPAKIGFARATGLPP